ncbi:MAG: hypothetical protein [Bacteriophage sp.]|nr:MAG: hypothetical protein [Bacteriophage sp.]
MRDLTDLQKHLIGAELHGHCRVDYTDPITGKVLERVEGDNHVFMDQFMAQDFQGQALSAALLITNGEQSLDTDLPYLPGTPIGYGTPSSEATGIYQGSFRSVDSYRNRITQQGITNLYVYDFLTTQIPDTIRYVGLTAAGQTGVNTTPFTYRWPRNNCDGIYDIERKIMLYRGTCSLSNSAGGDGQLYIYKIMNEPTEVAKQIDLFALCEKPDNYWPTIDGWSNYTQGYQATWGYDYENQTIVLKLMRYCIRRRYEYINGTSHYCYVTHYSDDFWVISKDGSEVVKHFQYKWNTEERTDTSSSWQKDYHFWTGNGFPAYTRLYGDKLYAFSRTAPNNQDAQYNNVFYVYQYDITTGDVSYERYNTGHNASHPLMTTEYTLHCYKGYTFASCNNNQYNANYGFTSNLMGVCPMYDVYTDDFYTNCPVANYYYRDDGSYLIEKGQTSVYGKTWNVKPPISSDDNIAKASMPFAYTAYQLPSDAPVRPANSAVTIAYGLEIKW